MTHYLSSGASGKYIGSLRLPFSLIIFSLKMNPILLLVLFTCSLLHYVHSQCSTDQDCASRLGVNSICIINYCRCKYGYTSTGSSCVPEGRGTGEGNNQQELNTAKMGKFAIGVGVGAIVILAIVAFCFYKRRQSGQRRLNV